MGLKKTEKTPKEVSKKNRFPGARPQKAEKGSIVTAFHARLMIGEIEKRKKTDHGRRS
jgi:hypothetical protein